MGLGVHSPAPKEGCALCGSGCRWKWKRMRAPRSDSPRHVPQGNASEVFKNSQFKLAFQNIMNVYCQGEEWNILYLSVSWLGLHILNIHTYVSELPFISTLTLGPENLRYGPDWNFFVLCSSQNSLLWFFQNVICHSRSIWGIILTLEEDAMMVLSQHCTQTSICLFTEHPRKILQLYEGFKVYQMVYLFSVIFYDMGRKILVNYKVLFKGKGFYFYLSKHISYRKDRLWFLSSLYDWCYWIFHLTILSDA